MSQVNRGKVEEDALRDDFPFSLHIKVLVKERCFPSRTTQ